MLESESKEMLNKSPFSRPRARPYMNASSFRPSGEG